MNKFKKTLKRKSLSAIIANVQIKSEFLGGVVYTFLFMSVNK